MTSNISQKCWTVKLMSKFMPNAWKFRGRQVSSASQLILPYPLHLGHSRHIYTQNSTCSQSTPTALGDAKRSHQPYGKWFMHNQLQKYKSSPPGLLELQADSKVIWNVLCALAPFSLTYFLFHAHTLCLSQCFRPVPTRSMEPLDLTFDSGRKTTFLRLFSPLCHLGCWQLICQHVICM